ncbi:MAG: hypothetical protein IJ733_21385 [Lachnospiraceae bacterium]|nr:hypothetical protein [Lachnospiraceae bacterium]
MIDLSKIEYRAVIYTKKGKQYNIKDFVQNLGWEENENEISVRTSFTIRNNKTSKGRLSSLIKPGYKICIFATDGKKDDEVARGEVVEWNPQTQNSGNNLKITVYDVLYDLQKSQDNKFYPKGTGTKTIVTGLFKEYKIPTKKYSGPNKSHGKLKYNGSYVSDIILDVLADAKKKGAGKYILRATKGYADVVKRGTNKDVYVFKTNNTKSVSKKISTADLVTRVKVIGKEDDKGKSKVEATLNGLTNYGIRQRIYTRGTDESLKDAKSAAQDILDDDGVLKKEITVQAPDVPWIRKGDYIYLTAGVSDSYYYVKGIRHDCESYSMTMDLKKIKTSKVKENKTESKKKYKEGDIVNFHGGTHYVSSYKGAKGYPAKAGKAKIYKGPNSEGNGKAHPWCLIHTDSKSNVYGWVDEGTFD